MHLRVVHSSVSHLNSPFNIDRMASLAWYVTVHDTYQSQDRKRFSCLKNSSFGHKNFYSVTQKPNSGGDHVLHSISPRWGKKPTIFTTASGKNIAKVLTLNPAFTRPYFSNNQFFRFLQVNYPVNSEFYFNFGFGFFFSFTFSKGDFEHNSL